VVSSFYCNSSLKASKGVFQFNTLQGRIYMISQYEIAPFFPYKYHYPVLDYFKRHHAAKLIIGHGQVFYALHEVFHRMTSMNIGTNEIFAHYNSLCSIKPPE
jgi:hypothetical protein